MSEDVECKTHPDAPHGFVRNASHTQDRLVCECEYWEEPKVSDRIRLLANQARKHYPGSELSGEYWVFDEQLFGKLIVKECAAQVDWILAENGKTQGDLLKQRFGINDA